MADGGGHRPIAGREEEGARPGSRGRALPAKHLVRIGLIATLAGERDPANEGVRGESVLEIPGDTIGVTEDHEIPRPILREHGLVLVDLLFQLVAAEGPSPEGTR